MIDDHALQGWLPALLFVPGDDERKLQSALRSSADALIVDLEDSVAPAHKSVARAVAEGLLLGAGTANVLVRINEPAGPMDRQTLRVSPS